MKIVTTKEVRYLMSTDELAHIFRVTPRTINKWTNDGVIDFVRGVETPHGGRLYDLRSSIVSFKDYQFFPEDYARLKAKRWKPQGFDLDIIETLAEYDIPLTEGDDYREGLDN